MRIYFHILSYIFLIGIFLCQPVSAKDMRNVKRDQQNTQREIKETSNKLKHKEEQVGRQLNQYNLINAEITENEGNIKNLNSDLENIKKQIGKINDTITIYENQLSVLRDSYIQAIKKMQGKRSDLNNLSFIFSSSSFQQATRRISYLKQFSKWQKKQTEKIKALIRTLDLERDKLKGLNATQENTLAKLQSNNNHLKKQKKEQAQLVKKLKSESSSLKKILQEKRRQAEKLDRELNRLIAEEERKAAERARIAEEKRKAEERRLAEQKETEERQAATTRNKVNPDGQKERPKPPKKEENDIKPSKKNQGYIMDNNEEKLAGSFEDNKGKLKSPVSAPYKIVRPFGRQRHPELRHVETNNGGIDVETQSGANACAVFDGKVSVVFKTDGFNIAVMVRHGNYLTVYVNLENTFVETGDKVKAGQALGKIYSDPNDDNRTILHFEIRKEKAKLNPTKWIR